MKLYCLIFLFLMEGLAFINGSTFSKYVGLTGVRISELGSDVIFKEDTSLRGKSKLKMLCTFKCTATLGCQGFLLDNQRCILIGDSTLSGVGADVFDLDENEERALYKDRNGE